METLNDLFEDQLSMLYDAEKQIIDILPEIVIKTSDEQLEQLFLNRLAQTKKQERRLVQIGEDLEINIFGQTCKAMRGIIQEIEEFLDKDLSDTVIDAGIITKVQQAVHHKIAAYGTASAYAEELADDDLSRKLKMSLEEEKMNDEQLTDLSIRINSSILLV